MPSKRRHGLFIIITVIGLFFASVLTSYAETVNYIYDDLNRLIRVVYDNGRSYNTPMTRLEID